MILKIYPKRQFVLPKQFNAVKKYSTADFNELLESQAASRLEKAFEVFLPQMPFLSVRGHSDKSREGYNAYLISNRMGLDGLPSEETMPSGLFYGLLNSAIYQAFTHGKSHASNIPGSSEIIMSFFISQGCDSTSAVTSKLYHLRDCVEGLLSIIPRVGEKIFKTTPDHLAAQLIYDRASVSSFLDNPSGEFAIILCLRLSAIIYLDTLDLLIQLAGSNWGQ